MKLLILCVLVAAAAALVPVYEPDEMDHTKDHSCLMCGDPLWHSFDHMMAVIKTTGKVRMFKAPVGDAKFANLKFCKFEVDCVIQETYFYDAPPKTGPLYVDWCGVAFWETKNGNGLFRNWMLGQNPTHYGERGVGFGTNTAVTPNIGWFCRSLPNTFPKKQEKMNTPPWVHLDPSLKPKNACPNGVPAYTIKANGPMKRIEIRSDCCPFAIDWYPAGRDTCINIFMKKGAPWEGHTKGLCGNANGDPDDDYFECDRPGIPGGPVTHDQAGVDAMVASCHLGPTQAMGYTGGSKLHAGCADPGPPPLF